MSRLKNFAHGVISGYVQMAANIVFTIFSVPLALHYLGKEEFALWSVIMQVMGYFALIDLGMTASVARALADDKDDRDGGRYGSLLKAGALVFGVQGLAIALVTWFLAPLVANLLEIDVRWKLEFVTLLRGCGLVTAFGFLMKIWGAPLWAYQRYDVGNYATSVGFAVQIAGLWLGFIWGLGLKSMLLAYTLQTVLVCVWCAVAGAVFGMFPKRGAWGRAESGMLRSLFGFGRDMFLLSLGSQLLTASHVIIVARFMGLEAAATWAIGSKFFSLAQQGVFKIFDSSAGALTEMFVRKENLRLQARFRDVAAITASLSVALALVGIAANASFLNVWTRGRFSWPVAMDVLLAVGMVVICVDRCFIGIGGVTKEIRLLRFIYFIEGLLFVALAWFLGLYFQLAGIAAASIIAAIVCSGAYGVYRARRDWSWTSFDLLGLLVPAGKVLVVMGPLAFVIHHWMNRHLGLGAFVLGATVLSLTGLGVIWWVGIPASLKDELRTRLVRRQRQS